MITKENITIAALRLFLLRGYKYVSLMDVAGEVGITKGGIYYYFASKEELLHVSVHFLFDCLEEKYLELFNSSKGLHQTLKVLLVSQDLERYAENLLGIDGDYRLNYASFVLEVIRKFPDIQERIDRSQLNFCQALELKIHIAMEQGEIRSDLDSHSLAVILLAILGGQHPLGAHFKTPAIRQQILENIEKMLSK